MTTENPDTEAILAEPTTLTLSNGLVVKVERLKTRATLALMRILTRGAGEFFRSEIGAFDPGSEEFQGQLIAAVLFSIPEAPDETIDFIRLMVKPAQLREEGRITPGDRAWNEDQWNALDEVLADPEIEDLIDVTVELVRNEAPHIAALGKKIAALIPTMRRSLPTNSSDETTPSKPSARGKKSSTRTTS